MTPRRSKRTKSTTDSPIPTRTPGRRVVNPIEELIELPTTTEVETEEDPSMNVEPEERKGSSQEETVPVKEASVQGEL